IRAGLEILKPINSIRIREGSLRNSGCSIQRLHLCAGHDCAALIGDVAGQGTIENLRLNRSLKGKEQHCENSKCSNEAAIRRHSSRLASLKPRKHSSSSINAGRIRDEPLCTATVPLLQRNMVKLPAGLQLSQLEGRGQMARNVSATLMQRSHADAP